MKGSDAKARKVEGWTVECSVHFRNGTKGRKRLRVGEAAAPEPVVPGNVPRVSRLLQEGAGESPRS